MQILFTKNITDEKCVPFTYLLYNYINVICYNTIDRHISKFNSIYNLIFGTPHCNQ